MNKNKNSMIIMFSYYFIFVSISFFLAPFLINKGFLSTTVGLLNTIGLGILVVSLLLFGIISDVRLKTKQIIEINMILTGLIFLILMISVNKYIIAISYILIWTTFMSVTSLIDGLILKNNQENNYSSIRAIGSLGAACSYFINSYVLSTVSFNIVISIDILLLILIIIQLTKFKIENTKNDLSYKKSMKVIIHNKNIYLMILITFLTYGVITADDAYTYTYNTEIVNINGFVVGLVGFLSIMLEFLLMKNYNRIINEIKMKKLLYMITILSCLIFYSKGHLYNSKIIINLGNILLGVFTGLFIPITINYLEKSTPKNFQNTILGIYQIAIKLGGAFLGLITTTYLIHIDFLPKIYDLHLFITAIALILISKLD